MSLLEPDNQLYVDTKSLPQEQPVVEKNSIISALVGIQWQGHDCLFCDWSYFPTINLWRDYLPPEIESKLPGMTRGDEIRLRYSAGELLEAHPSSQPQQVSIKQFQPAKKGLTPILPAVGRFYPKDFFAQLPGVYEGNKFPCRITSAENNQLTVDLNHPLATKELEMIFRIETIKKAGAERGGRCNDIVAAACDHGPGMQDSLPDRETDFWSNNPFSRLDAGNDSVFFSQPSLAPFWDSTALQQVSELYNRLIPQQAQLLDLMAGVHSPLQDSAIKPVSVCCAGLNQVELDNNPICNERLTLDVNSITALPFRDKQFDVVLIHAAIEYVINPEMLFAEISRVLNPSGRVIISFTNRSIAQKTSQLWAGAHEFERPAIVLAYLRSCGSFGNFNSYSKRGLFRPEDDELADKLLLSDPVFAVWADKI